VLGKRAVEEDEDEEERGVVVHHKKALAHARSQMDLAIEKGQVDVAVQCATKIASLNNKQKQKKIGR